MIATKEKGASLVEASSGERPFSQKVSDRDDMGSDIRHGDESCTIDPDLVLFKEMTESMTKWRTGASEQDPDISADPPEQDPDILANLPERIERKNDELVNGIMPSLPLRRLRTKQPPVPCILSKTTTSQLPMPLHSLQRQTRHLSFHNEMLY